MPKLDGRHRLAREFCGYARRRWVFRFCGEWVASYPSRAKARAAALIWEAGRLA